MTFVKPNMIARSGDVIQKIKYLDSVKKMPLMELPVRSYVVQLKQAVVLISPGSQLATEQLRSAGPVTDIVAPSMLHTAGVARAQKIFPQARVWGPNGFSSETLDNWPYQDELPAMEICGMPKVKEWVFFEPTSKTLMVADLFFNLVKARGFGSWLILNIFGTYRKFGVSRLFYNYVEDKRAFTDSMHKISKLDFDTIAPSHGELLDMDAKSTFFTSLKERGIDLQK